jgi:hypothetical protein
LKSVSSATKFYKKHTMTPEEIKVVIEQTIDGKLGIYPLYILGAGVLSLIVTLIVEYFKTRAKNLATKHDIEILTQKVEDVKIQYAKQMEIFKSNYQLKSLKIKEMYDNTENLYQLIIMFNNPKSKEGQSINLEEMLLLMQSICITIASSSVFENLISEGQLIENQHNYFIDKLKRLKANKDKQINIDTIEVRRIIKLIQKKLINPTI